MPRGLNIACEAYEDGDKGSEYTILWSLSTGFKAWRRSVSGPFSADEAEMEANIIITITKNEIVKVMASSILCLLF